MKTKKQERGITLVALILTVILLVILSAVGISVVYNSRIIEYAINGTMKYGQEGINENKILEGTENTIDSVVDKIKDIGKVPTPVISIPEPNGENGWYKTEDVTVIINDGEADVNISPVKQIVYILDGQEIAVEGRTVTVRIDTDGKHKIKAYATDGSKKSEETVEYTIKRDVADPNKVELSIPTEVTTSSFKVTGKGQDETSGIKKFKFELSTGEDFSTIIQTQEYTVETATTEERTQEHTLSGLNDGTPYYIRVTVTDEAGRTSTSSTVAQNTVVANTAPSKAQVSYNTKGTNYIKVNAKSEDVDGDNLTYTLRYGTDQNNLNLSTDLTNQTQNVQVAIQTEANLSQYTYYYWRVDVSDGKVTTEGDVQTQVRTYCQAISCGGGARNRISCPTTQNTTNPCSGTMRQYQRNGFGDYNGSCIKCYSSSGFWYVFKCFLCEGEINVIMCQNCAVKNWPCMLTTQTSVTCPNCKGLGYYYTYSNCTHGYGYGSSHYYCDKEGHGSYRGSSSLHD